MAIRKTSLTRDELLDNVMLYWLPDTAASSARLYWESFNKVSRDPVKIPDRLQHLPERDLPLFAPLGREALRETRALERPRQRRSLRRVRAAATFINEVRTCFRHMR